MKKGFVVKYLNLYWGKRSFNRWVDFVGNAHIFRTYDNAKKWLDQTLRVVGVEDDFFSIKPIE